MIATDGRQTIANAPALPDFCVRNEGTIFLVDACTARAKQWLEEHVDMDDAQRFGKSLAVDHRYIYDLVDGMFDAGFKVV